MQRVYLQARCVVEGWEGLLLLNNPSILLCGVRLDPQHQRKPDDDGGSPLIANHMFNDDSSPSSPPELPTKRLSTGERAEIDFRVLRTPSGIEPWSAAYCTSALQNEESLHSSPPLAHPLQFLIQPNQKYCQAEQGQSTGCRPPLQSGWSSLIPSSLSP